MPKLEFCLLAFTAVGLILGTWGIWWARTSRLRNRASWGRSLFIGTLLFLGGSSLVAAFQQADGLVPLGLLAGSLVTCMLWETPGNSENRSDFGLQPEEA
ncbi:MAG TPA: hypothetical protein VK395_00640 [Gemmataceae bacterium]|nr:hypothetical protein [Gemmataceae bacterium]